MQYFFRRKCNIFVSTEKIHRHIKAANFTNKRLRKIASQRDDVLRSNDRLGMGAADLGTAHDGSSPYKAAQQYG